MAQHSIWFELLISWRALASHGCYARAVPGCTMIYLLPVLLTRCVPDAGSCCCGRAGLRSTVAQRSPRRARSGCITSCTPTTARCSPPIDLSEPGKVSVD
jgi:hypothetical protein